MQGSHRPKAFSGFGLPTLKSRVSFAFLQPLGISANHQDSLKIIQGDLIVTPATSSEFCEAFKAYGLLCVQFAEKLLDLFLFHQGYDCLVPDFLPAFCALGFLKVLLPVLSTSDLSMSCVPRALTQFSTGPTFSFSMSMEMRKLWGDLIADFQYLKRAYGKEGE